MLILGESCIEQIEIEKIYKFPYFPLPKEEAWKIDQLICMVEERKENRLEEDDLQLFDYLCVN